MDGWMYRRTLGWSLEGVVSHVHWSHTAEAAPPRHIPAVEGKYIDRRRRRRPNKCAGTKGRRPVEDE